jgi:regulator of sigma E protease
MFLFTLFAQFFFISAGIIGIGILITIHELGHFLFCKLFNVFVPSFSIGFGPVLWKKKIGETNFLVSAIPLGGFVEIAGSAEIGQGEQKEAHRDDERSLARKPYWQKLSIMLGGVAFNLIFAYIVIIGILATGAPGTPLFPETMTSTIEIVTPGSAAEKADVQAGDKLISLNNVPFDTKNPQPFIESLTQLPGTTTAIVIERKNVLLEKEISFDANKKTGILGVAFATQSLEPLPFWQAVRKGINLTNKFIANVGSFLKRLFTQHTLEGAGGPVGIIAAIMGGAQKGIKIYLLLLAIISINLAVLNLIPLPILDGGQVVFYTIEAIIGRQIPHKIKEAIAICCWIVFLLLAIYLTYYDIKRIILSFLGK